MKCGERARGAVPSHTEDCPVEAPEDEVEDAFPEGEVVRPIVCHGDGGDADSDEVCLHLDPNAQHQR